MRPALLIGAIVLLAAGCTGKVQAVDGTAAPVTASPAPSPAPSSAAPTSPPTSPPASSATPAPKPTAEATLVLGPNGYGKLKLGMSYQAASATGLIDPWRAGNNTHCQKSTNLKAAPDDSHGYVFYSTNLGLEIIEAYGRSMRTPEGIHIGSASAAVLRAYPDWASPDQGTIQNGRGYADVPGNSKAAYRFMMKKGKVTELTLQYNKQDCYE